MIKRHSWQIEYLFWYSEYISFSPQALKISDDKISFAIISETGEELFLAKVIFSSPTEQQETVFHPLSNVFTNLCLRLLSFINR